ncbi:hypothetical protein FOMPIDRAFT_1026514, partial [Fomitopsis schrenkii]
MNPVRSYWKSFSSKQSWILPSVSSLVLPAQSCKVIITAPGLVAIPSITTPSVVAGELKRGHMLTLDTLGTTNYTLCG